MLEDAEKAEADEEWEEDLEWRIASLAGSGASSGPPRPRVAMSSTKEGRVVMVAEDKGRGEGRRKPAGDNLEQLWHVWGDYNGGRLGNEPRESGCHERAGGDIGDVMEPRRRRA